MDILKISLVNLPEQFSDSLSTIIKQEKLGACKAITSNCSLNYFSGDIECTNFIVIYDKNITEEQILLLKAPKNIPVILITDQFSFEMERTAKSYNIDLIVKISDPDLLSLIYGFISQFQIYQSQHVLVVDDSRVDSYVVSSNLTRDFLKNDNEHNPENVINVLTNVDTINIIILDYEMPNKNGCQLMQEIKNTFPNRYFIFIGITGNRNGAIKFLNNGADDVFVKPLDLDIFSVTLRKLIYNAHKIQLEKNALDDYKNIIKSISKDIYDPIYVLSTVNDLLLENADESNKTTHVNLLCDTAKTKLTSTLNDLLSYLELSKYLHDSSLKSSSLHTMISSQLYIEASRAKIRNIMFKESLSPNLKELCIPDKIEQVISYFTQSAVNNSSNGSDVHIRLYPDNFKIVFEVEDTRPSITAQNSYSQINSNIEHPLKTDSLDYVLSKKVIDSLGGSMGMKHGEKGDIYYFELPSYSLAATNLH